MSLTTLAYMGRVPLVPICIGIVVMVMIVGAIIFAKDRGRHSS